MTGGDNDAIAPAMFDTAQTRRGGKGGVTTEGLTALELIRYNAWMEALESLPAQTVRLRLSEVEFALGLMRSALDAGERGKT